MPPNAVPLEREAICPDCGSEVATVQGLIACTDCDWVDRPDR
jgi:hypothetical protein